MEKIKLKELANPKPPIWEKIPLIKNETYVVYLDTMGWVTAMYLGLAPDQPLGEEWPPLHVFWNELGVYHVTENWIVNMPEK